MKEPRHLLITGVPGSGKTTLLIGLARQLADLRPVGFYTEEIREGSSRQGFHCRDGFRTRMPTGQ
jgi:nucleoside-triphosphatase